MLKNISVRTFIVYFLLSLFLLNAAVVFLFTGASSLLITLNVINVIALFLLWIYMTQYLVTPINTVKKVLKKSRQGILA